MTARVVRLGVVGLGRAFSLMLPTLVRDERFQLVAAATPGERGRRAFEQDLGGRAHADIDALCADDGVEAVYLASPHEFHCDHVLRLAAAGKHCLVDKPLAISTAETRRIVDAVDAAGIRLVVGPSHSFDAPVLLARQLVDSGILGGVRQISASYYTDFLYRPRRPAELDTGVGGGVIFSQAVHQVDVVRFLAGGNARSVTALTGAWDPERATEGAYGALLAFDDGVFATLTYNGYGCFDGDTLVGNVSELGFDKAGTEYVSARERLAAGVAGDEADTKRQRNLGYTATAELRDRLPAHQEHFGQVIVSCDRGDIRLTADGIEVFAEKQRVIELPAPVIPRREVMDEFHRCITEGAAPLHDARWGHACIEVVIAMLESARSRRVVPLAEQSPVAPHWQTLFTLTGTAIEQRFSEPFTLTS